MAGQFSFAAFNCKPVLIAKKGGARSGRFQFHYRATGCPVSNIKAELCHSLMTEMMPGRKKHPTIKLQVEALRSPAREQGPHLLPIEERERKTESRLEHYIELADTVLGNRKPKRRG